MAFSGPNIVTNAAQAVATSLTGGKLTTKQQRKRKLPTIRVSVVGAADAGKSDVLSLYTDGRYAATQRPPAGHQRTVSMTSYRGAALHVCDTPADVVVVPVPQLPVSPPRSRRSRCGRALPAVVAVYTVEDRASLDTALQLLRGELCRVAATVAASATAAGQAHMPPGVLLGTWAGVRPSRRRVVTYKQGRDAATHLGVGFHEFGCNAENPGRTVNLVHGLADGALAAWVEREAAESAAKADKRKLVSSSVRSYVHKVLRLLQLTSATSRQAGTPTV